MDDKLHCIVKLRCFCECLNYMNGGFFVEGYGSFPSPKYPFSPF